MSLQLTPTLLPHKPNRTVEVNYGFDSHTIHVFCFSDLKTIENRGDGDPDGVIGEVEARADPAHNKDEGGLMGLGERMGRGYFRRYGNVCGLFTKPEGPELPRSPSSSREPFRIKHVRIREMIRVARHRPWVSDPTYVRDPVSRNQMTNGLTRYWPRQRALWAEGSLGSYRRQSDNGQAPWAFISGFRFENNATQDRLTERNCEIPPRDLFDHRINIWRSCPVSETTQSFGALSKDLAEFSLSLCLHMDVQSHR